MKNLTRTFVAACSLLFVAACAGTPATTTAPAMLNSKCVISGEDLGADTVTTEYMGGKVGFCCDKCMSKWNAMDDAAKKAAIAKK
jgi:hypothetical protein